MILGIDNKRESIFYRIYHYLFKCPTFWRRKSTFKCPICGKKYRYYWNGNDNHGFIDICSSCDITISLYKIAVKNQEKQEHC